MTKIIDFIQDIIWTVLVTAVGCGILYCFWSTLNADGKVAFCFIEEQSATYPPVNGYILYGNRPWRPNLQLDYSSDRNSLVAVANQLHCPLK